jgi:hypothetical protein
VLSAILRELTGQARGRREQRMQVLHRSSVVLLVAAFEAYCEEIIMESIEVLANRLNTPANLPTELQRSVAVQAKIPKDKNELYPWDFAESGWRSITVSYVASRLSRWNSPSSSNLQVLFCDLLGIEDIRQSFRLRKISSSMACEKLDELILHRGSIAHGTSVPTVLSEVQAYKRLVENVTSRIDTTVEHHLGSLLKKSPW